LRRPGRRPSAVLPQGGVTQAQRRSLGPESDCRLRGCRALPGSQRSARSRVGAPQWPVRPDNACGLREFGRARPACRATSCGCRWSRVADPAPVVLQRNLHRARTALSDEAIRVLSRSDDRLLAQAPGHRGEPIRVWSADRSEARRQPFTDDVLFPAGAQSRDPASSHAREPHAVQTSPILRQQP
jgi:hypothetical protein